MYCCTSVRSQCHIIHGRCVPSWVVVVHTSRKHTEESRCSWLTTGMLNDGARFVVLVSHVQLFEAYRNQFFRYLPIMLTTRTYRCLDLVLTMTTTDGQTDCFTPCTCTWGTNNIICYYLAGFGMRVGDHRVPSTLVMEGGYGQTMNWGALHHTSHSFTPISVM